MIDPHPIRQRFTSLSPHLSERERRLFAAIEARAAGYGGIAAVSAATGIAVSTIGRGLKELSALDTLAPDRVRRPGGGRKLLVEKDATLLNDLLALVEPSERGDPRPSACCRRAWPAVRSLGKCSLLRSWRARFSVVHIAGPQPDQIKPDQTINCRK